MKHVDLGEATSFLDHVYLGCTQRESIPNEGMAGEYRKMLETRISAGANEKLPESEKRGANVTSRSCEMEGLAKKCVKRCCELAKNRFSNCTRSPHHALTIITSKRKNWKRWENCQKFALKSSGNVCIWHALVDRTVSGR